MFTFQSGMICVSDGRQEIKVGNHQSYLAKLMVTDINNFDMVLKINMSMKVIDFKFLKTLSVTTLLSSLSLAIDTLKLGGPQWPSG